METTQNTKVLFVKRPEAAVDPKVHFKIVKEEVPKVEDGYLLVKNIYLSLDPAMRGWMNDRKSYIEPVKLNDVMRGGCVGQVVASKHPKFKEGDIVSGMLGWQEYTLTNGKGITKVLSGVPLSLHLGLLGMTGLTAYFGLLDVGKPKEGNTVLVSGAAGATGSVVGQIAKIKGCRVVGIAGSDDKCDWLVKELGFDAAINYKKEKNLYKALKTTCPKGIDVYFDNVGGQTLDTALTQINIGARVVICGAISQYNISAKDKTYPPHNYLSLLTNRATMQGFIVFDYAKYYKEATQQLAEWYQQGKLKNAEVVVKGLEKAPEALNILFEGDKTGKLIVQIASEPAVVPKAKL